jgi:hypothetical protein
VTLFCMFCAPAGVVAMETVTTLGAGDTTHPINYLLGAVFVSVVSSPQQKLVTAVMTRLVCPRRLRWVPAPCVRATPAPTRSSSARPSWTKKTPKAGQRSRLSTHTPRPDSATCRPAERTKKAPQERSLCAELFEASAEAKQRSKQELANREAQKEAAKRRKEGEKQAKAGALEARMKAKREQEAKVHPHHPV